MAVVSGRPRRSAPGIRLRRTLVGVGALLVALIAGNAAPANAADRPEILISSDGVRYKHTLDSGLFDGFGLIVPGDSDTAVFWVKNPTGGDVETRVSVRDFVAPSAAFAQVVTLSSWDSVSDTTGEMAMADISDCRVVVPSRSLAPGEVVEVRLQLSMLDVADRVAQDDRGALSFVVSMRDGEAGPFPPSACDDDAVLLDPDAEAAAAAARAAELRRLAMTGSDLPTPVIVAAGVLIGSGLFLVARRRRRREDA